ncbi:MAG: response regulator [Gammaproteobacteria bacterium]|nr:response regulator [Gammaproteobacteria bacterium]
MGSGLTSPPYSPSMRFPCSENGFGDVSSATKQHWRTSERGIRRRLVGGIMLLLATATISVVVIINYGARNTVETLTQRLADASMARVEYAAIEFFESVERLMQVASSTWSNGGIGYETRPDLERLNDLFIPLLNANPRIGSMMLAHDGGFEYLLMRDPRGGDRYTWYNRVVWADRGPDAGYEAYWTAQRELVREQPLPPEVVDYDPRKRRFYREAPLGEYYWTDPYYFFITRDAGITAVYKWRDRATGQVRLVAFDLLLEAISSFTSALKPSPHGRVFLTHGNDALIGLPADPRWSEETDLHAALARADDAEVDGTATLSSARDLGLDDIAVAIDAWRAGGAVPGELFEVDADEDSWGAVRPLTVANQTFNVGAIIPRDDFLDPIRRQRAYIVMAALVTIGIAALMMERVARRLAREVHERERHVEAQARTMDELAHQLSLTQSIIDALPDPIFYKGPDARFVGFNIAYEKAFGVDRQDLIGKRVQDLEFLPADDREAYRVEDEQAIRESRRVAYERTYEFADGAIHQTLYTVTGFARADGKPGGLVGVIVDLTDLKQVEAALRDREEVLRTVLDCVPLGVAAYDEEQRLQIWNDAFADILGLPPGALWAGRPAREIVIELAQKGFYGDSVERGDLEDFASARLESAFRQKISREELVVRGRHYDAISGPTPDGGLILAYLDISEHKALENALVEAREEAEQATRVKSDFLANMSHEIRTPMNAIIGLGELALRTDLDATQRDYLTKVLAAARNLLGIINDILDFSKIEAGKLRMERVDFDLDEVLENLSNTIGMKAHEKNLDLVFAVAPDVPRDLGGDPLRLGQVLLNLVSNAIKFTDAGSITVGVRALAQDHDGPQLEFSVTDTGIGLSEEQRGRLFQAFSQADGSTSRKYGGTGLGLTICKRLVELMHGDIEVESTPGVGSTFRFTCRFTAGAERDRTQFRIPDLHDLRVLVVDDNAAAREVLARYLEDFGCATVQVASGEEALEEVRQAGRPFDVVLMDWRLPGMDGVTAARALRARPGGETIRVVMVSAYGRTQMVDEAHDVDIAEFLVKPVSESTLFNALTRTLHIDTGEGSRQTNLPDLEWSPSLRGARVLVVDDNEINRQITGELLAGAGMHVDFATNGREAVDAAAAHVYDAIYMDVQMPVLDGFSATREIRRQPAGGRVPVVAMTANAMAGDRERCLEAGMDDYVSKPIDLRQLVAVSNRLVTASRPAALPLKTSTPPRPAAAVTLPDSVTLDVAGGLARVGGNRSLYAELLRKLARNQADWRERISVAIGKRDQALAVREAHTLKGVAGNVGARPLQEAAARLEVELRAGLPADASCVGAAAAALDDLLEALSRWSRHADDGAEPAGALPTDALVARMRVLRALVEDGDTAAIAELVTLRGALEAQFGGAAVRALVSALEGYDFDAGSQALAALEARLAAETAGTDTLGRQHVEALRRRLEQDDTAATELLREMRRLSASDANRAALGIIENAVRCYDFEAALDAADKLLDNL